MRIPTRPVGRLLSILDRSIIPSSQEMKAGTASIATDITLVVFARHGDF
jgi:hypothetical protein